MPLIFLIISPHDAFCNHVHYTHCSQFTCTEKIVTDDQLRFAKNTLKRRTTREERTCVWKGHRDCWLRTVAGMLPLEPGTSLPAELWAAGMNAPRARAHVGRGGRCTATWAWASGPASAARLSWMNWGGDSEIEVDQPWVTRRHWRVRSGAEVSRLCRRKSPHQSPHPSGGP